MKRLITFALVPVCIVMVMLLNSSCSSTGNKKCLPCPMALQMAPNLTFKVVDKTTGTDLFFGATAKYNTSQLKVHHIINGHPDTAYLRIDTPGQKFNVRISAIHEIDTVTMNIADKPQDILLFKRTITGGCCSTTYVSSITFNGIVVYQQHSGPEVVATLEK